MFSKLLNCRCSDGWMRPALLVMRLGVGLAFFAHGLQKVQGDSAVGFFGSIGIPLPGFFGPLVTWLELLGGAALVLGLLTHLSSKLLAINMAVAVLWVHVRVLFAETPGYPDSYLAPGGPELAFLLFGALFVLMVAGPGMWAIDNKIAQRNAAM
jgi:putative oxidoreductase